MSHSLVRIVPTVRANGRLARAEAYGLDTLRGAHPGLRLVLPGSGRSAGGHGDLARLGGSVRVKGHGTLSAMSHEAMSHEVTLLVRADCPACAAARADIARICAELGVAWHTSDVDADPGLRAEYGDRIPVILIDGREHGFWTVQEQRLRAALGK